MIIALKYKFKGEPSSKVFDFFVENYNQYSIQIFNNFIWRLSYYFGEDKEFAFHIFEFLQNNAPNPVVFRTFANSFEGIKSHFSDPDLQQSLIEILSTGIQSDDESKKEALNCFYKLIINIPISDSNFPVIELIEVISSDVQKQSTKETKLLNAIMGKFPEIIAQNIEEIVKMIDSLINEADQVNTQIDLFYCYTKVSNLKEFLPYSQNLVSMIIEVFKNPKNEQLFFVVMIFLPLFKHLMNQETMNELFSLAFSFLFSEVYDDEGNIYDCFIEY